MSVDRCDACDGHKVEAAKLQQIFCKMGPTIFFSVPVGEKVGRYVRSAKFSQRNFNLAWSSILFISFLIVILSVAFIAQVTPAPFF